VCLTLMKAGSDTATSWCHSLGTEAPKHRSGRSRSICATSSSQNLGARPSASGRNTSGHIGVYRIVQKEKGNIQIIWAARWTHRQGKIVMRRFSVRRHGEERAKRLAIMARAEGIRHTSARPKFGALSRGPHFLGFQHGAKGCN
jgi:AP2 domain